MTFNRSSRRRGKSVVSPAPAPATVDDEAVLCSQEAHSSHLSEATRWKHAADGARDREARSVRYLQSVVCFCLCGRCKERGRDLRNAFTMYNETLTLVK
jgi:hypothetical protein